jgi:hypothetical protein
LKHFIFRQKKKYDQYPEEPGVLYSKPSVSEQPVYREVVANNIPYDPNSIIEYRPVVFNSDKQTISVVLFIRNMELSYLNHSLFTLSNQSVPPLEIVLVESSNTREFISRDEEIASKYPLVRIVYAPTDSLNVSYSINVGIQAAKGDYIMFAQVDLLYSVDVMSCVQDIMRPNVVIQGPRGDIVEGTNIPDAEYVHEKWKKLVGGIFSGARQKRLEDGRWGAVPRFRQYRRLARQRQAGGRAPRLPGSGRLEPASRQLERRGGETADPPRLEAPAAGGGGAAAGHRAAGGHLPDLPGRGSWSLASRRRPEVAQRGAGGGDASPQGGAEGGQFRLGVGRRRGVPGWHALADPAFGGGSADIGAAAEDRPVRR